MVSFLYCFLDYQFHVIYTVPVAASYCFWWVPMFVCFCKMVLIMYLSFLPWEIGSLWSVWALSQCRNNFLWLEMFWIDWGSLLALRHQLDCPVSFEMHLYTDVTVSRRTEFYQSLGLEWVKSKYRNIMYKADTVKKHICYICFRWFVGLSPFLHIELRFCS